MLAMRHSAKKRHLVNARAARALIWILKLPIWSIARMSCSGPGCGGSRSSWIRKESDRTLPPMMEYSPAAVQCRTSA